MNPGPAQSHVISHAKNERSFFNIASASTALAFGCGTALMESLQADAAGLSVKISYWTLLAFAAGAGVAFVYWWLVAHKPRTFRRTSWLVALAGVAMFLYPLRFIPVQQRPDIAIGLALAVLALSTIALFLWLVSRFLNTDTGKQRPD